MNPSLFIEYIDKYFRLVIGKITEKINGKKTEKQLLHKTMLTEEYSADLTWGSTELNTSVVEEVMLWLSQLKGDNHESHS